MTPIKFWVFPRSEALRLATLPPDALYRWEEARPGVLEDRTQDIFSKNARSEHQRWKDFSLFQQVGDPADAEVVTCLNWLELGTSFGCPQNVPTLVEHLTKRFSNHIVAFSWNIDVDSQRVPTLVNLPGNALLIDFNGSSVMPQSVMVPVWNVCTNVEKQPKSRWAGFRGWIGNVECRKRLRDALHGRHEYLFTDNRLDEREYLRELSRFKYSLCPRGGGLNSYRYSESVQAGSVPVLFGDDAALPFPDLDYSTFAVRIPESQIHEVDRWDSMLRGLDVDAMTAALERVAPRFSLWGVQQEVFETLERMLGRI